MMWSNFFRDGGWGMYPTTLFGFFLVAAGVLLVLRPERRFVFPVVSLGVLTLISGVLGSTVGVINTFRYLTHVAAEEQLKVAALGCAESLNNLVLALLIGGVTGLLASVAALRISRARTTVASTVASSKS